MDAKPAKARGGQDPADLAIAGVDRALGRLVDLLKADDPDTTLKVLSRLSEFGTAQAVAVLLRRFEEAKGDVLLRVRIVHAVCAFGADPAGRLAALRALSRADRLEIEPVVLVAICSAEGMLDVSIEEAAFLAAEDLRSRAPSTSECDRSRRG
jgi:hypothetical protein